MRPATVLSLILLTAASSLPAQEVTLPLARYEELREQAHPEPQPEPEPPVPVAFEEAVFDVDVGTASARVVQELVVDLYGHGWQAVPLAAAGTFVDSDFGALEGRIDDGKLAVRGGGRHRVRLTSAVAVTRDETATRPTWTLQLAAPRAAVVRGTLRFDAAIEDVEARGPVLLGEPLTDGRRPWVAPPGCSFGFVLLGAATVPERARLPLRFDAVSATVLDVARTRRRLDAWLAVRVLQGELEALEIPLPEGFEVVDVGGSIAGWDVTAGRLEVTPLAAVTDALEIKAELAGPPAEEFASPALTVDGAASALVAAKVNVRGDGLLNLLDAGAARQPEARQEERLPAPFRSASGLALVVPPGGAAPRWQVTWSESTEVLAAQVDRLLIDAVVGDDGRAAYQLWAEVRSSGAASLTVDVAGAELIVARRGGVLFVPGRTAEGWAIPLSVTSETQVIHLALVLPLALPSRDGELALPVPALSAPAARIEARVRLPPGRRYRFAEERRAGYVGRPPGEGARVDVPLLAQQVMRTAPAVAPAMGLFAAPIGFETLEAAWSALSSRPAPLAILVDAFRERREWF